MIEQTLTYRDLDLTDEQIMIAVRYAYKRMYKYYVNCHYDSEQMYADLTYLCGVILTRPNAVQNIYEQPNRVAALINHLIFAIRGFQSNRFKRKYPDAMDKCLPLDSLELDRGHWSEVVRNHNCMKPETDHIDHDLSLDVRDELEYLVSLMTVKERRLFELRYRDERTLSDLGNLYGVTKEAIRMRLVGIIRRVQDEADLREYAQRQARKLERTA